MHSALYTGRLRHRRYAPQPRAFDYRLFMAWLDLAELERVFRDRWFWSTGRPALAWMKRADYLGDPGLSLDEAVRERVARETGVRPAGPVRLLTHLRMFGHCFNPVSFYYCYDARGERVETVLAEITNTPWNERHAYVLPAGSSIGRGRALRFRFDKAFHVSPFLPMDLGYDWRFTEPGERLAVHMENFQGGLKVFDATLALERREISGASLAAALARFPFMTVQVLGAIYWQALRLWARRTPYYAHP
jgi:uncharacterized protein